MPTSPIGATRTPAEYPDRGDATPAIPPSNPSDRRSDATPGRERLRAMGVTDRDLYAWPVLPGDDDLTSAWRIERFLELGYTPSDALHLADQRVDHHELARLIARGCPRDTAARILA